MFNWKTIVETDFGELGDSFEYYAVDLGDLDIVLNFDDGQCSLEISLEEGSLDFEARSPEEAKRLGLIKLKEYFSNIINQLERIEDEKTNGTN